MRSSSSPSRASSSGRTRAESRCFLLLARLRHSAKFSSRTLVFRPSRSRRSNPARRSNSSLEVKPIRINAKFVGERRHRRQVSRYRSGEPPLPRRLRKRPPDSPPHPRSQILLSDLRRRFALLQPQKRVIDPTPEPLVQRHENARSKENMPRPLRTCLLSIRYAQELSKVFICEVGCLSPNTSARNCSLTARKAR
jgi:hypothetical protein